MHISVEHVTFCYLSPFSPVRTALSDVSLEIRPKEIVAIVGATGSGKTTLMQHFNGLLKPTQGRVFVDSMDLSDPHADLDWVRKKVGLVFQFPEIQLFEETVYGDVAFGPRNMDLSTGEVDQRVRRAMEWVDLDFEKFRNLSPFRLSGGEKRRVALAGVLAMEPQVLVLDEPTVGLDARTAHKVETVLHHYHRDGRAVVFVSHDMDLVGRLAQRVLVLEKGRVVFDGTKHALFQNDRVLKRSGLTLPHVYRFMATLKERGYPVRTDVFCVEQAKREIRRVFEKSNRKNSNGS